MSARAT